MGREFTNVSYFSAKLCADVEIKQFLDPFLSATSNKLYPSDLHNIINVRICCCVTDQGISSTVSTCIVVCSQATPKVQTDRP